MVVDETGADSIAIRSMVYLALTYDHRLVDGADAARFLTTLKAAAGGRRLRGRTGLMRIAVTGASGLIGGALVPHLRAQGHEVLRLVRRRSGAPDEVTWDPMGGTVDVGRPGRRGRRGPPGRSRRSVTIAGPTSTRRRSGTHGPWAPPRWPPPWPPWSSRPSVLVSGSAIGFYGDTGDPVVDEGAPAGSGFLADVVVGWEAAAQPARDAGIRVVHPRTGLVVAGRGGAWAKLWPLVRLGVGGKMGTGRQWWSFISMRDELVGPDLPAGHTWRARST